ncbi:MAG: zinc ribbon domain-containing protein [Nitrososphaerales archaeon]
MKELFGWVQGSDMAATYVHLSGRDVDSALLKLHGLKSEEEKKDVLKLRICPRCGEKNDPIARFCKRCASPLDVKTALEFEEMRNRKDEVVARVIERLIGKLNLEQKVYEVIKELKLEKEFEKKHKKNSKNKKNKNEED